MNNPFSNPKTLRTVGRAMAIATVATAGMSANAGTIDTVLDRVNNINSRTSTINSRVYDIRSKVNILENRPEVRDLATRIPPELALGMIRTAKQIQDAVGILDEQRLGINAYVDGGGADAMRNDLRGLFTDIAALHEAAQQLRCFQDPEVSIVALNLSYATQAVDHIPALALMGMQKALDEVVPDWRTAVNDVYDLLPVEEVGTVCGAANTVVAEFNRLRCEVLRNVNPTRLTRTQRKAKTLAKLFAIIKEYSPDEVTVQFSLTVVGGGGAGTSIKLPLKGIFQTVISVLNRVEDGASKVEGQRQACLDADEKIERDVLSCMALASYDSDLETVRDVVLRRLMSLGATNQTWNDVDTAQNFGQICTSYRNFRIQ